MIEFSVDFHKFLQLMIMSSNENNFHVTGSLWREPRISSRFPSQRPATQSFDVFFDVCFNKWLNKQWNCWWFEHPWCPCDFTVVCCTLFCSNHFLKISLTVFHIGITAEKWWNVLPLCHFVWRWQLMCPCCQPYHWPCSPAWQTQPLMLWDWHWKHGWLVWPTVVQDPI